MDFDGRLLSGLGAMSAVVEAGSFVRAAEALGLTQSGVSRAIARLEERLGIRLFERTPRAVILTDDGRTFYERVAPLLTDLGEAASEAAGASKAVRGRLRVNVDPMLARLVLAPKLPAFLAAYPEISLDVAARNHIGDLVAEGFDIAVRFGEPEPSAFIARKLLETRVVTCASRSYIRRHGRPAKPDELRAHECILYRDPGTGRPFPWEFHRKGKIVPVRVNGRLTVNDGATMLGACAAGWGVAQILELVSDELRDGRLVELLPSWNEECWPLYVFYPSKRLPPAKVRAFVDFVIASVKDKKR